MFIYLDDEVPEVEYWLTSFCYQSGDYSVDVSKTDGVYGTILLKYEEN